MKPIDALLNKVTMYKLVVFGLGGIALLSIALAAFGVLSIEPLAMLLSLALLLAGSFLAEFVFSLIWRRPFNSESWLITALIIFLIFPAPKDWIEAATTLLVAVVATSSKYLVSWQGKHIFNPAAVGVVVAGFTDLQITSWWVGSAVLWPVTLLFGLLVVRKMRKFALFFAFAATAIGMLLITFSLEGVLSVAVIQSALIASPLIFLATIMLTEPATMPPRRNQQMLFGAVVAVLYVGSWTLGPVTITPGIALLIGNLYAFIVSPKFKVELQLKEIQKLSDRVYNYVFLPPKKLRFTPGQYMEWTLPHVAVDARGNRRSFTVASSPTEQTVQLGVKFYEPSSTFKSALKAMKPGDPIFVSQLAGSFVLNGSEKRKLVFIAGGIGVTPFRSMVKYIADTQQKVDIVVLYIVADASEFAYLETFRQAAANGVRLARIVTSPKTEEDGLVHAQLDETLIRTLVPDFAERSFYVSGPNAMVDATQRHLKRLGVPRSRVKKDHFSGY